MDFIEIKACSKKELDIYLQFIKKQKQTSLQATFELPHSTWTAFPCSSLHLYEHNKN